MLLDCILISLTDSILLSSLVYLLFPFFLLSKISILLLVLSHLSIISFLIEILSLSIRAENILFPKLALLECLEKFILLLVVLFFLFFIFLAAGILNSLVSSTFFTLTLFLSRSYFYLILPDFALLIV